VGYDTLPFHEHGEERNATLTPITGEKFLDRINNQQLLNILKPTGYVMHHQFNIQQFCIQPRYVYELCIYLKTNSDLCHFTINWLVCITEMKCLLRGTDWAFK
jgi:hypothetical protein